MAEKKKKTEKPKKNTGTAKKRNTASHETPVSEKKKKTEKPKKSTGTAKKKSTGTASKRNTTSHKTKDSVFVNLFEDKENVLQLYQELHPEDTSVTIEDINIETLKTILINEVYNDLGFVVGKGVNARFIILVEAQSAWNPNMTLRILIYLVNTLRDFIDASEQDVHSDSIVSLPQIELYVLYSGDRKNVPDEISFSEDYFKGNSPVDVRVKILHQPGTTIYGQYIGFCKVYNEQRKLYGNDKKCAEETIRICIEKGYLVEFLKKHKKEVITMLDDLFNEKMQREKYNAARDKKMREEGRAEGRAEGKAEGKTEGMISTLASLVRDGILSITDAANRANMNVDEFKVQSGLN